MKNLINKINRAGLGVKVMTALTLVAAMTLFAAPYFVGTGPAASSKIVGNDNRVLTVTYNLAVAASSASNISTFASFELKKDLGVGFAVSGTLTNTNTALTFTYQRSLDGVNWEWPPQTLATGTISSNANSGAFLWLTNLANAHLGNATRFVKLYTVTAGTNGCTISTISAAQFR